MPNNVLQVDCSVVSGVEWDQGSAVTADYIQVDVAFNSAAITALLAGGSPTFEVLGIVANGSGSETVYIGPDPTDLKWAANNATPFAPSSPIVAMQFYRVKIHFLGGSPATFALFIDGVAAGTDSASTCVDSRWIDLCFQSLGPGTIMYFDNFRAGTTDGGTELGSDDFEGGSLSFWNSTISGATIVTDPGISPVALPPVTYIDSATVNSITTPTFVSEGIDGNIITSHTTVSSSDNLALLDSSTVSSTTSLSATEVTTTETLVVTEVSTGLAVGDTVDFVVSSTITTTTSTTDVPPPPPTDITYAISITTTDYNNQSWIVAYSYNSGAATTAGTVASFDGDNGLIPIA